MRGVRSTGYERDMNGICLNNISRWSNPLHTGVSGGLRGMLGISRIRHKNFLDIIT